MNSSMNTTQFRLAVGGQSGFRFDNVAVHSRSLDVEGTTAHTYNSANQLVTSTTNGVVTNHTYDPWGRLATRTQGAYAASYEWRYGDKLKAVTSNFPGEAASVAYDYDGLGKRRSRTTGAGMTWWRWGLGWDTLAEYTDPDTDGDIEGFSKFNVMMGMMHPLAEATVPSGQPPANAAYSYLALDHLSSTRAVFSQAKAQTAAMEFFPYGGRLSTSGTLPHHQFTAKPYDTGTNLYNFLFRNYSPAMARWTAADPAGTVDGPNVYSYSGNSPIRNIDAKGTDWTTLDFIEWYFLGDGETVNLRDVGLLDDFQNDTQVSSFVSCLKNSLGHKLRQKIAQLRKECKGSAGTRSGSVSETGKGKLVFGGPPWSVTDPLYVLGEGTIYGNGNCSVTMDCCTGCYRFFCNTNFSYNDMFKGPISRGRLEFEWPCCGTPYDIMAYWSEHWVGGGGGGGCPK